MLSCLEFLHQYIIKMHPSIKKLRNVLTTSYSCLYRFPHIAPLFKILIANLQLAEYISPSIYRSIKNRHSPYFCWNLFSCLMLRRWKNSILASHLFWGQDWVSSAVHIWLCYSQIMSSSPIHVKESVVLFAFLLSWHEVSSTSWWDNQWLIKKYTGFKNRA